MGRLYEVVAARAGRHHGAISTAELASLGVTSSLRAKWVQRHLIKRAGPHSFVLVGSPVSAKVPEVLVHRTHRGVRLPYITRTTPRPLENADRIVISGVPCLDAERLIIEAPRYDFSVGEIENAIDSAVRLRRVDERRLRARVLESVRPGSGGAAVREAMIDTGGESRLERWFLAIVRTGGLPRPRMRVMVKARGEFSARLDASFPGGLVVELEGHATHSSRRQRQHDEERRTAMTLQGHRVIVFTYNDVRDRPDWVLVQVRAALALVA